MELGAMVCVPNGAPHCEECPWNAFCEARLQERIDELPVKKKKAARRIEERTVFILRDGEKIALHKRPGKGLLAGLYELPNCEQKLNQQEALQYIEDLGYRPIRIVPLAEAKHIFSHVEWQMDATLCIVDREDSNYKTIEEIEEHIALPSAFMPFMKQVEEYLWKK